MRRAVLLFGLVLCICCAARSQNPSGLQAAIRPARFPIGESSNSNISMLYVDGVAYSQLASAIQACPQTCWIIDTHPETFTNDPFAFAGTKSVRVTLSRGTWTTSAPIRIPTKSQLDGSGRGDGDFSGTVLQAASSFPQGAVMIEMGNIDPSFGVRIENLTIDCNHVPGVIGVRNDRSEEQSGLRHVLIENITGIGLDIEGSGAQNSGPYEDLEFAGGQNSNVTANSLCAKIVSVDAFRGIHGATCNFSASSVPPRIGIQMDSSGTLSDIHTEGTEVGIGLGVSTPATGAILQNIYGGGANISTVVHVYSGQNILMSGLVRGNSTKLLVDDVLAQSVTDTELALYIIGNGAAPEQSRFSSSIGTDAQSRLSNLTVSNLAVLNLISKLAIGKLTVTDLNVTGTFTNSGGSSASQFKASTNSRSSYPEIAVSSFSNGSIAYQGIVVLDAHGEAEIRLPESLNRSGRLFQYQLTPVGGYAPVFVASEVNGNSFHIGGGKAGLKVSWSVMEIVRP